MDITMPTVSFDTVCQLFGPSIIDNAHIENQPLLKILADNNIVYCIINPCTPSGWPEIAYTGTYNAMIRLFELFDPYSRTLEELQEAFAYWDGSAEFAENILS